MKQSSAGSCLLLVISCAALLSILAVVIMHRAYYIQRTSTEQVYQEQRSSTTEAFLRYGIDWYRTNRELVDSQNEPGPWRLTFDDFPVGTETCNAEITISPVQGEADISARLYRGRVLLAQISCHARKDGEQLSRMELAEWTSDQVATSA